MMLMEQTVSDRSGGYSSAKLIGNASIDSTNQKFGTGALLLDGNKSWAEVGILRESDKVTREEELIGWWKFDEGSGNAAFNSVTADVFGYTD